MIYTKQAKKRGMSEIDTYYSNDFNMSEMASEVLGLLGSGKAADAKLRWEEIHRRSGNTESENLIKGIILSDLGEKRAARELLWREFDNNRNSFIRALHWMLFIMEEEINNADGAVYDAERLVETISAEWGERNVKTLALRSCFALFLSDYPTFLEYLQLLAERAESPQDVYWAYCRAAESVEAELPRVLRNQYTEFLKKANKDFPVDVIIYEAMVKSLFIGGDFNLLEKLAKSEILAGNVERLSESVRIIFATVMLAANRGDKARVFCAGSATGASGTKLEQLFGSAVELNCLLLESVPQPRMEQLADLEIMTEKIEALVEEIRAENQTESALVRIILCKYEEMARQIKCALL